MWWSRPWRPRCLRPRLPPRSKWCAKVTPRFIRKSRSRRSTCASVSAGTATHQRMTNKKTHKEPKSMPNAAQKLVIVHRDETPMEATSEPGVEPATRPEELRLLEALLFAAGEPLDEATLARPLADGVDLKDALARLKAEYATRGVN